jgi:hypothetical protein
MNFPFHFIKINKMILYYFSKSNIIIKLLRFKLINFNQLL